MLRNKEKKKEATAVLPEGETFETDTETDTSTDCFSSDDEEGDMDESQKNQVNVFEIEDSFNDRETQIMEANAIVLQAEITCKLMEGINEEWSALRNNNKRKN